MVMGSLTQETQVLVIGGGPGGYVAAIRAADLGKEVVLVDERPQLGGVCLLEGCIPSKTLIHAVDVVHTAQSANQIGLHFSKPRIDLSALRDWKGSVIQDLASGVRTLLDKRGVEIIQGRAKFDGPHSAVLEHSDVSAIQFEHAIIATGSRPAQLPFATDGDLWTSRQALEMPEIPQRLVVIGGGYIGLELSLVYAGLGARVDVVEFMPRLLTGADPDLVKMMLKNARRRLHQIHDGTKVTGIKASSSEFTVSLAAGDETQTLTCDRVLVAIGRRPNTEDLGLTKIGIETDDTGAIKINDRCQTKVPHIYAIGDVTPGPMLAHKASREARVAAEVIAGQPAAFDNRAIPAVVFTDPEIAWTGLTETEAQAQGVPFHVGRFPLSALGRAKTLGRTDGLVKVLSQPDSGLLLGVGMVAVGASELIAEACLALEMGATLEDLMVTIHPHPTLSESLMEAAEVASGMPVHVLPPRMGSKKKDRRR